MIGFIGTNFVTLVVVAMTTFGVVLTAVTIEDAVRERRASRSLEGSTSDSGT